METSTTLAAIRSRAKISQQALAQILGVSFVSVNRWERGLTTPSPAQTEKILTLFRKLHSNSGNTDVTQPERDIFASRGLRRKQDFLPLLDEVLPEVRVLPGPLEPVFERLVKCGLIAPDRREAVRELIQSHSQPAYTAKSPPGAGMSAGKNTYTYDAHTYHTKVPPQGIAELLKHYLPDGGLVFDPFAGSGMTGVAARATGHDCILNELSPAACFIANRFVSTVSPALFEAGVEAILNHLQNIRATLYTTLCRECGRPTEILYTVWSYSVLCSNCGTEFLLWDHCRKYGRRVREHKILTSFPCPACRHVLRKSLLKRTLAEPIQLGYMCCGSRQQEVVHPLNQRDLELIYSLEISPPVACGFYPTTVLPDGVNLRQPKHHGLDRIDRFYTPRNLSAMSHLWKSIHCIEDNELAAHLAFVFTSLYQRVTRLSEFRFWGGSGNTARFNVPFIFNEANVFTTFARKARSIQDHLETTASHYRGAAVVVLGSATHLDYLPDESVDLIFTDPPFGANINYSEMNLLWEAWLGRLTNPDEEAIINRVQGKNIDDYRELMTKSLTKCYRVLRRGHWMLLVFMNSSARVWAALREAVEGSGFEIRQVDIFDKNHGTFKQFVSDNTAGYDLLLHCLKVPPARKANGHVPHPQSQKESVYAFLEKIDFARHVNVYLHVDRSEELDVRKLYSEWTAQSLLKGESAMDLSTFRSLVEGWLKRPDSRC